MTNCCWSRANKFPVAMSVENSLDIVINAAASQNVFTFKQVIEKNCLNSPDLGSHVNLQYHE